jgi:hypothetical protein
MRLSMNGPCASPVRARPGMAPPTIGQRTTFTAGRIVGSWARAGCLFGAVLGSITGALLATTAVPLLAIIGIPVGALLGSLDGLAVGILDGVVLSIFNQLRPSSEAADSRKRSLIVAGTTALAGYLPQQALFGAVDGRAGRFSLLVLPILGEAILASWLSRRLPPSPAED